MSLKLIWTVSLADQKKIQESLAYNNAYYARTTQQCWPTFLCDHCMITIPELIQRSTPQQDVNAFPVNKGSLYQ